LHDIGDFGILVMTACMYQQPCHGVDLNHLFLGGGGEPREGQEEANERVTILR
jgi:hypothetical protein